MSLFVPNPCTFNKPRTVVQVLRKRPSSGETWCTCQGIRRRVVSSKAVTEEAQNATEAEAQDATEDRLESVKIEEERQPNSHIELTVTIPARRCAKAWQRALRQAGNKLNLSGFRKGKKVRADLISKQYTLHANPVMTSLNPVPAESMCPAHSRGIMF